MKYEWRDTVVRIGPPKLMEQQPEGAQFRSVYGFPESTATVINRQCTMKNLDGKMLYSDTLLVDVDDEGNKQAVLDIINTLGIGYMKCTTGNRGFHLHIPIDPMVGVNVVYSQKHWLQSVGLWSLIDRSIYRPAGQFRALGAVHRKTGNVKRVVETVEGRKLSIKIMVPPPVPKVSWDAEQGSPETVFNFYMNLLAYRSTGQRHMHAFIIWKSGRQAGVPREELEDCIRWWNNTMTDYPHSERTMEKKLKGFPI